MQMREISRNKVALQGETIADKPVQRASLKEKLEVFKVKAVGVEKQEVRKEKRKEVTI